MRIEISGLRMYGKCSAAFHRAEHLLNNPAYTRKELLETHLLFRKNPDSLDFLQAEFGERFDGVKARIESLFDYYAKSKAVISELEKRLRKKEGLFLESIDKSYDEYAQTSSNALLAMAYLMNNEKEKAFELYNRLKKRKSFKITWHPSGRKQDLMCVEREYEYVTGNAAMAVLHYMMDERESAMEIINNLEGSWEKGVYSCLDTLPTYSSVGNALIALLLEKENNPRYKQICSSFIGHYSKLDLENYYAQAVASDVMMHLLTGSHDRASEVMAKAEDKPELREDILFYYGTTYHPLYAACNAGIAVAYAMLGGARI